MDNSRGVIYFNHGDRHLARLIVSIFSLRKHYGGPVTVMSTAAGWEHLAQRLVDPRLRADVQIAELSHAPRHACYVTKSTLWRQSPYGATVQLDSDTIVAGSIDPLFDAAEKSLVITAFSNWTVRKKIISDRLDKWRRDYPQKVAACLQQNSRAVNTGVLAYSDISSHSLGAWEMLTTENWRHFICDEIAMQILITDTEHIMLDDRWNCSPLYGHHSSEAVIWHFHGSKHLRPEAKPIWWRVYESCRDLNVGSIRDWTPAGDKRLAEFLARQSAA